MSIKLYMGFKTQRISGLLVRKQIPNDAKDFSGGAILPRSWTKDDNDNRIAIQKDQRETQLHRALSETRMQKIAFPQESTVSRHSLARSQKLPSGKLT